MTSKTIDIILAGGVGIMPTDTVYGIVCSVFSREAVLRLYRMKKRDTNKPPVVIISEVSDLNKFGVELLPEQIEFIKKYWPGKVTIIFNVKKDFAFLDKGKGLAIRLPADEKVRSLLKKTGPLATSSANLAGAPTAKNIAEAKKYFGDEADFYEEGGELNSLPSTLVDLREGKVVVLRKGAVDIL